MTERNETFVVDDYGKKSTFASFLPGIAGIRGIPIWCYYVNRGQCVVSFGLWTIKIMRSWNFIRRIRHIRMSRPQDSAPFLKKNGTVFEPFFR